MGIPPHAGLVRCAEYATLTHLLHHADAQAKPLGGDTY